MQRISSNTTLFFKIFVPCVYVTFFGSMSIAVLFSNPEEVYIAGNPLVKYGLPSLFMVFVIIMYLTIMQLKRVEFGAEYFLVSNYFKTFRYTYRDIIKITLYNFGLFTIISIKMREKTRMGKKFRFIAKRKFFEDFVLEHSNMFSHIQLNHRP
jgi:hypothetical protein